MSKASDEASSHVLTDLDVYCWGPFGGRHAAHMDLAGTAIIGPTGSGKTTLIDALMTLLVANPRYNLASTGGHESDRDLVSYVRGVSGAGNDSNDNAHVGRPGAVVSAIAARLSDGQSTVRIGAVFWFEGTSSALADLKRRWLFCLGDTPDLDTWLEAQRDGGARGLKELERQLPGVKVYEAKQAYLSRLRSHFDVGESAFSLLNRAAGLKQLNSIDEVFRELVLDDRTGFDGARSVTEEFDVLMGIRGELETARRQRDTLLPVERSWADYQAVSAEHQAQQELQQLLPTWYAGRRLEMWNRRAQALQLRHHALAEQHQQAEEAATAARQEELLLQTAYLQCGGAALEGLRERIQNQQGLTSQRRAQAALYQKLGNGLQLAPLLDRPSWEANRQALEQRHDEYNGVLEGERTVAWDAGSRWQALHAEQQHLNTELAHARSRTSSNVPVAQQMFRGQLAAHLGVDESELPFVAEQVQLRSEYSAWRGAIERALGSERLRLLVAPDLFGQALAWVNGRNNKLHVRLLDAAQPGAGTTFFDDGFARRLEFKPGPHREALKALVGARDRHCVDDAAALRRTAHAMTIEGSFSNGAGRFDKQDQKALDQDWMTGFNNRDRVRHLEQALSVADLAASEAETEKQRAEQQVNATSKSLGLLERLRDMTFEEIDLPSAEQALQRLESQLEDMLSPDSEATRARTLLEAAQTATRQALDHNASVRADMDVVSRDSADTQRLIQITQAELLTPLDSVQLARATSGFPDPLTDDPQMLAEQERSAGLRLAVDVKRSSDRLRGVSQTLLRELAAAKASDTGSLSEAGVSIDDVPVYCARLKVLNEEALPEKLARFLDYLNQSTDQGVTQLLSQIDIEVQQIEERIAELNTTLRRVDFQQDRYLQLDPQRVEHESLRSLQKARQQLRSAQLKDDQGESHYHALWQVVALLRDAAERRKTQGALALLDPRYRLRFAVLVVERGTDRVIEKRTSSQGGSGGEKEIIASYVLTASLSYALCPQGRDRPLFGTIVLDEAFSKSSHAVAGRIVRALHEFGLHALFVTPNKELRLLREHTRSAIVVHRRGAQATLTSLSWAALDEHAKNRQLRREQRHEVA